MSILEIKKDIATHIGKKVMITYNLGRNKYEEYDGIITELYDNVFLLECEMNTTAITKSFSYRDIMTKIIHIDY